MTDDLLPLDQDMQTVETRTATFALGCFWGPDARFGVMPGVVRTRVGYAGGDTANPTYHDIDGHTETVQIDYNPETVTYHDLLQVFWRSHDPSRQRKTQYRSLIFVDGDEQRRIAEETKTEHAETMPVATEIRELDIFHVAEDYHQKYRLRQQRDLMQIFDSYTADQFRESTVAARLNGYVAGHGTEEQLKQEIDTFGLSDKVEGRLKDAVPSET